MPYSDLHPVNTQLLVATVWDSDKAAGNLVMIGDSRITRKPDLVFDLVTGIKHGFLSSSDAELLLVQLRLTASDWSYKTASLHLCHITEDIVLMTNEMHNSYNQFLFHSFLSALHVSNESSSSSSGARHNVLYYTVWDNRYNRAGESSCFEAARLACTIIPNCVIQYIMPCS